MNTVSCITIQEFAVFMTAALLETVEFVIERHETNDSDVCCKLFLLNSILIEVPVRIRPCFEPTSFTQMFLERGVDVECEFHAYRQSNAID